MLDAWVAGVQGLLQVRELMFLSLGMGIGEAILDLSLNSITVKGRACPISTRILENTEKGKGKRTAAITGGGAAGGALIGGIAGGGKGVGIGALVGGATGLIGGAVTGNKQIEVPAESVLTFRLSRPVRIPPPGE